MIHAYREEELVKNRAAVLLFGGSETDRRAWAEEASAHFESEGGVREVTEPAALLAALSLGRGVVFIPDATALGWEGQAQVLRCLQYQEERPKIVVGLGADPEAARSQGTLREDLHYRLHQALVNLATPGLKDEQKARRRQLEAERKARQAKEDARAKKAAGSGRSSGVVMRKIPATTKPTPVKAATKVPSEAGKRIAASQNARSKPAPAARAARAAVKRTSASLKRVSAPASSKPAAKKGKRR